MARLRDIKVGQTVWIKRGRTDPNDFSILEQQVVDHVGGKCRVHKIDPDDTFCTVYDGSWWWPTDWISLTPPKGETQPKEGPSTKGSGSPTIASNMMSNTQATIEALKPSQALYIGYCAGHYTSAGTLDKVIEEIRDNWNYTDEVIKSEWTFYEVKEVSIQYTPSKFEVL